MKVARIYVNVIVCNLPQHLHLRKKRTTFKALEIMHGKRDLLLPYSLSRMTIMILFHKNKTWDAKLAHIWVLHGSDSWESIDRKCLKPLKVSIWQAFMYNHAFWDYVMYNIPLFKIFTTIIVFIILSLWSHHHSTSCSIIDFHVPIGFCSFSCSHPFYLVLLVVQNMLPQQHNMHIVTKNNKLLSSKVGQ